MRELSLILAVTLALSACVPGRVQVDSMSGVGSDELLLVGRIELVPPLDPESRSSAHRPRSSAARRTR